MATLELIQDVLTSFCQIWTKNRGQLNELVDIYYKVLKKYTDKEIQDAAWKCLDELGDKTRFPKPADISQRIKRIHVDSGLCAISKHPIRCSKCGEVGICIQEPVGSFWECRECYTGLKPHEIEAKYAEIYRQIGKMR